MCVRLNERMFFCVSVCLHVCMCVCRQLCVRTCVHVCACVCPGVSFLWYPVSVCDAVCLAVCMCMCACRPRACERGAVCVCDVADVDISKRSHACAPLHVRVCAVVCAIACPGDEGADERESRRGCGTLISRLAAHPLPWLAPWSGLQLLVRIARRRRRLACVCGRSLVRVGLKTVRLPLHAHRPAGTTACAYPRRRWPGQTLARRSVRVCGVGFCPSRAQRLQLSFSSSSSSVLALLAPCVHRQRPSNCESTCACVPLSECRRLREQHKGRR